MQLTPDKTTIGRAVDSVLFSVRIGTDCLLGQFSGSEYTSSVQAALHERDLPGRQDPPHRLVARHDTDRRRVQRPSGLS